jgi:hypothetical protein
MKGQRVVLIEDYEFHKLYKRGHQFTIIDTSYRGWDIEDDDGNRIYECLFIHNKFVSLDEWREEQIDKLI